MDLKVNEIFYSIQGESSFAGRPCAFVRLTGCNLRCAYCDTRYAYEEGREMSLETIAQAVEAYGCSLVEITGGEPLFQKNTPLLVDLLVQRGFTVLVETNGSLDIGRIGKPCIRIMDVKCPSSGESKKNDMENLNRLGDDDELKFVIADSGDYAYALDTLRRLPDRFTRRGTVHFSPAFGQMAPRTLAGWILGDRIDVRLHLQLHKFIWPRAKRGV